jgi:hypothetical protein
MPFSMDSKLGDILKDPRAVAILDKHVPGASKHPQIAIGRSLQLKTIVKLPQAEAIGFTREKVEAILAECNQLQL